MCCSLVPLVDSVRFCGTVSWWFPGVVSYSVLLSIYFARLPVVVSFKNVILFGNAGVQ